LSSNRENQRNNIGEIIFGILLVKLGGIVIRKGMVEFGKFWRIFGA
jgi:hypothetical protein